MLGLLVQGLRVSFSGVEELYRGRCKVLGVSRVRGSRGRSSLYGVEGLSFGFKLCWLFWGTACAAKPAKGSTSAQSHFRVYSGPAALNPKP